MDPSGGGIGKAASELMQEMQKAQSEAQDQLQDVSKTGGANNFQQHMQANQSQQVNQTSQHDAMIPQTRRPERETSRSQSANWSASFCFHVMFNPLPMGL